jgi:hypothetical protein
LKSCENTEYRRHKEYTKHVTYKYLTLIRVFPINDWFNKAWKNHYPVDIRPSYNRPQNIKLIGCEKIWIYVLVSKTIIGGNSNIKSISRRNRLISSIFGACVWCFVSFVCQSIGDVPLIYNITGGSARHQKVKPKTWRIFTFADARMTPLVLNPRGNYHWPTAILDFKRQFHPPGFWKKAWNSAESFIYKNHQVKMPSFCIASWCHNLFTGKIY